MRFIARLLALFWGGLMVTSVIGAVGAFAAKRRIVPMEAPDGDEVHLTAIFEPIDFRSTAASFRGGTVDCWYGGGVVDLRDAVLDPAGALLRVRAIFGGCQVLVPETWLVTANVRGIGGFSDARPELDRAHDAPHLTVEGRAIFGGFAVTSEVSEAQTRGLRKAVALRARRHREPTVSPQAQPAT